MPFPIIAEAVAGEGSTWQLLMAALLGGGLSQAASFARDLWRERKKARREETDAEWQQRRRDEEDERKRNREDKDESLTRMEKLLDRAERALEAKDRQGAAKDRQIAVLTAAVNRAMVRAERAVVWIKHLETTLQNLKHPFDPWRDDDEGDSRPPVPAAGTDVGVDGESP